jgi:SPP1 gp7 family putative phage head morphogenesis protein
VESLAKNSSFLLTPLYDFFKKNDPRKISKEQLPLLRDYQYNLTKILLYGDLYGRLSQKGKTSSKIQNLFSNFTEKDLSYNFEMPFDEAEKFFTSIGVVQAKTYYSDLKTYAGEAFTISYISAFETLNGVRLYLAEQLGNGKVDPKLLAEKIQEYAVMNGDDALHPWHIETIIRTNLQTAFAKGRFTEQVESPNEYWQYFATIDGRETDLCRALDGKVFRKDDPFWTLYYPPNHFNCRSTVVTLDKATVEAEGLEVIESISDYLKERKVKHPREIYTPGPGFNKCPNNSLEKWIKAKCEEHQIENVKKAVPVFKTKKEAINYYENMLGVPFKVNSIKKDTIIRLGNHLVELKDNYNKLGFFDEIKIGNRKKSHDAAYNAFQYFSKSNHIKNTLNINKAFLESFNNLDEMIKRACDEKYWTSKRLEDIITHEMGHCLSRQNIDISNKLSRNKYLSTERSFISKYGSQNLAEYLAESFVLYNRGENLPDEALKLLKEYLRIDKE